MQWQDCILPDVQTSTRLQVVEIRVFLLLLLFEIFEKYTCYTTVGVHSNHSEPDLSKTVY